jgi:hypothetical protein
MRGSMLPNDHIHVSTWAAGQIPNHAQQDQRWRESVVGAVITITVQCRAWFCRELALIGCAVDRLSQDLSP